MSSDPKGFYKILGLTPGASIAEVKRAYKDKLAEHHPSGRIRKEHRASEKYKSMTEEERAADEKKSEEMTAQINKAFSVLGDKNQKNDYDNGTGEFATHDFAEGGFGSPFDFMFRRGFTGGQGRRQQKRKAENITAKISVTLADIFKGVTKKFKINILRTCKKCSGKGGKSVKQCSRCNGVGVVIMQRRAGMLVTRSEVECPDCKGLGNKPELPLCDECSGAGLIKTSEIKQLYINPGTQDDVDIVMVGEGNEMPGGVRGDIVFHVDVTKTNGFERIDNHLIADVEVDLLTFLTGGTVYFTHLDESKLAVNVQPFSGRLDKYLVVPGEGFNNKYGRGDLFLRPNLINSQKLNRKDLSQYIEVSAPSSSASCKSVRGSWCDKPKETSKPEEHDYNEGHTTSGFAEDIMRGFGFF